MFFVPNAPQRRYKRRAIVPMLDDSLNLHQSNQNASKKWENFFIAPAIPYESHHDPLMRPRFSAKSSLDEHHAKWRKSLYIIDFRQQPRLAVFATSQQVVGLLVADEAVGLRVELDRSPQSPSRVAEMAQHARRVSDGFQVGDGAFAAPHAVQKVAGMAGIAVAAGLFVNLLSATVERPPAAIANRTVTLDDHRNHSWNSR